jgi:hypothetical protein
MDILFTLEAQESIKEIQCNIPQETSASYSRFYSHMYDRSMMG